MDEAKIIIIGAGVVGLAIAAELVRSHDNVVVLEKNEKYGQETSSRNSEVVHAGIYYPAGSLKSVLCSKGARLLYDFCQAHSVPHSRLGKFIIATEQAEIPALDEFFKKGVANGAEGLALADKSEVSQKEPNVNAVAAIFSPNTGIIDSHSLMRQLHFMAESAGALFSFGSEVNLLENQNGKYLVGIRNEDYKLTSRVVINSAGLYSDKIAALAGVDIERQNYTLRYCKGSYFSYNRSSPVKRLIYPLPHEGLKGLGVHATLDLAGRLRFGPDAEYVDSIDYRLDAAKIDSFYASAKKMIPSLEKQYFVPDMAGIRPKLAGNGFRDFIISHEADIGLPGLVNLVGIESPGLTACLSIAAHVKNIVDAFLT
jgi:L-2-hydroxyglutarate oxidase LhgO